jgi:DNA invertase Pin-like site-specific DNA recombinase
MADTLEPLAELEAQHAKLEQAAVRLLNAKERRAKLVRKATDAGIRPELIQKAARISRATYYRIVGSDE